MSARDAEGEGTAQGFLREGGRHWPPCLHSPSCPARHRHVHTFLRVEAGYRMPCPLECPPTTHTS